MKQWHYRQQDAAAAKQFAEQEGIDPICAALLLQRGLCHRQAVKQFARPDLTQLCDPFLLPDMEQAVNRILLARNRGERVTVYGDYDVDGLTSTVLVSGCLRSLGIKTDCYIPDRMSEGYGLNPAALEQIRARGTSLVVTVDLGVTAVEEIQSVPDLEFVVTDHHQPLEQLPSCAAVVDPKRADCQAPFRELAGVGVAFKLVWALQYDRPLPEILQESLDLVALGTIADIVPLYGENRFFARQGLSYLAKSRRPGLQALIRKSGYERVDATAVGFGLAPRINAAGRMAHGNCALTLLTTHDPVEAERCAEELCRLNALRQQTEREIFEQADRVMQQEQDRAALVAAGQGWHQGVIGIVASKLMYRYQKPVVLLSIEEGMAHGSARSLGGFSVFDALQSCSDVLVRFGGHAKAGGLTLSEELIPLFSERFNQLAEEAWELDAGLTVDLALSPEQMTLPLAQKLTFFEPFGEGNPRPVFSLANVRVVECAPTRDGQHLRLKAERGGKIFSCIGFGMGELELLPDSRADLAFYLDQNHYGGRTQLNLLLQDIHPISSEGE